MNEIKYDEFVGVITAALNNRIKHSPQSLFLKKDAEAKIKEFYESCRRQMKQRMALHDKTKPWDRQRLDRHKIAAAICWAVTRAQPIDTAKAQTADDRIANETIAFIAPLQILMSFAVNDAENEGKQVIASYFKNGPALPSTTDSISFTVHVARCLYWQAHRNSDAPLDIDKWLDPFQLAIMYYMIDVFTSLEGQRKALELSPAAC